ncbi:MAG TPA: hypothetical protein VN809_07925, partial [Telmatospirillum sp.]|nr:hypothetical protein [Telmatospirillum sp.]
MKRSPLFLMLAGIWMAAGPSPVIAQEDFDLDRIPDTQPATSDETSRDVGTAQQNKIFLEDALGLTGRRNNLVVPSPSAHQPDVQARSSLDVTAHRDWADGLSATLSDRLDLSWRNDLDVSSHRSIANDFREAYLTWEPVSQTYVESGRVNLRNGSALGFNPTDFFKTRSLVNQTNLDPSALRNNRLGTFMVHAQRLWSDGSAGLAFGPKLADASPLTGTDPGGFDVRSGRTNAEDRMLVSLTQDIGDFSPQALFYHEADRTRWGLNLSHPVGQSIIAYGEWAGGRQASGVAEAVAFGKRTGTLPTTAPVPASADSAVSFKNDLALGASWTGSEKVTVNAEYHLHQAGLSRRDLRDWFASSARGAPSLANELWYVRSFAADQQNPLVRHQIFLRADWTDAVISHLELSAFAFISLYDGSSQTQLAASYDLSDHWSMGLYAAAN